MSFGLCRKSVEADFLHIMLNGYMWICEGIKGYRYEFLIDIKDRDIVFWQL